MTRYLITSALPYINGVKHLGNLAGSMLPADVHARFRRQQGHETLFICATDEHGTPAELAAAAAGQDVRAYCDEQHEIQRDVSARFDLSFDYFGRSSNAPNHDLTQHFCNQLEKNGLIEERISKQIFSIDDDRFLPDRYVEGTCPHCGFQRARGDQCDSCGALLDPGDLIEPHSKISGSENLEIRDTRHLFLLQSKMQDTISEWVEQSHDWPPLARSIARKWLNEGLIDRAITRDLSWGVPVAFDGKVRPGFEDKVFYVWFDAPIEYIGATLEWAEANNENWKRWWRRESGADDVVYVQVMGKDNVAFHTLSFPITMIGSGEDWKVVDQLKALNWVNWYGGKFSTSENRGLFMDKALDLLPSDYWRWHLTANAPESSDSSFTLKHFQETVNADLANVFGNFINRVTQFCVSRFDGKVPAGGQVGEAEYAFARQYDERLKALTEHHERMEMRKAAAELRSLWAAGNEYLQQAAPWKTIKDHPDQAAVSIRVALNACALFAVLAEPIIPNAAAKVSTALKHAHSNWPLPGDGQLFDLLPPGQPIEPPGVLFRKVEDAEIEEWATALSGDESAG